MVIGLVCVGVFFFGPSAGHPAEKIIIKGTSIQMPNQNVGEGLIKFKDIIEKNLSGRVEVKAYPSAQLYNQAEEIAALSRGDIQVAAVIGTGSMPIISPVFQVVELPGLFPSKDVFANAIRGPVGQELWAETEKKNIKVLAVWDAGKTQISNRKKIEIKFPTDAARLKIRPAGKTYANLLELWGALSVNVASEEQYSALQQGVMDGIMTAVRIIQERKLYEHLTNLTDLGYLVTRISAILASRKWWNGLPQDIQQAVLKTAQEAAQGQSDVVDSDDEAAFKEIEKGGVKIYRIPPKDFKVWQESARKVWPKMTQRIDQKWVDKFTKVAEAGK